MWSLFAYIYNIAFYIAEWRVYVFPKNPKTSPPRSYRQMAGLLIFVFLICYCYCRFRSSVRGTLAMFVRHLAATRRRPRFGAGAWEGKSKKKARTPHSPESSPQTLDKWPSIRQRV